ncbi:MAG: beta-ketoacyl-ACP synthase II [Phycisphaerae bacterium]
MFAHKGAPRRVVVTGMGIASPLGLGVEHVWKRLIAGESGISAIQSFDTKDLPAKIAGQVPQGSKADGKLDLAEWIPVKDQRKMDRFIQLALVAATEAVEDSGWKPEGEEDRCATGVMIGSGIGGLTTIHEAAVLLAQGKIRRISPFFIPSALINLASGHVSINYGFKGPNHSAVTACATGVHAIGDAARLIAMGDAEVMVAGGAEAAVSELGMAGFCAARALSNGYNETPTQASRPWDEGRDGFVMGEGSGVIMIEELEHAKKRGARIYAELIGYGVSADAYHLSAPSPDGTGPAYAIQMALRHGKKNPSDVNYLNAHATSTGLGDIAETKAIKLAFGNHVKNGLMVSSTKSMTGHMLGAAGGIELIACIMAIKHSIVPPTINVENQDPECDLDCVPNIAREADVKVAISNSFGFGGHNASVLISRFE